MSNQSPPTCPYCGKECRSYNGALLPRDVKICVQSDHEYRVYNWNDHIDDSAVFIGGMCFRPDNLHETCLTNDFDGEIIITHHPLTRALVDRFMKLKVFL